MKTEAILVTGGQGKLGRALAANGCTSLGRKALDICSPDAIIRNLGQFEPGIVINTAAYTDVDKAESEPDRVRIVNTDALAQLADICRQRAVPLIHLSTDYVFADHAPAHPIGEDAHTEPLNIYGCSKRDGERYVLECGHTVVRVSWLFDDSPGTFIAKILKIAAKHREIAVSDDEYGRPTPVADLANLLIKLANHIQQGQWARPILHLGPPDPVNRLEWARQIFKTSALLGGPAPDIYPVAAAHFKTPARRPRGAILDTALATHLLGPMPDWRPASAMAVRKHVQA